MKRFIKWFRLIAVVVLWLCTLVLFAASAYRVPDYPRATYDLLVAFICIYFAQDIDASRKKGQE